MIRLLEVLEFLGIPHFPSLKEWDQEDWIARVQQNRRDFRPKDGKGETLNFGPPQVSESQRKVVEIMESAREYAKVELGCSISTLRSLSRKGLVMNDDGEEGIWRRLETEWM